MEIFATILVISVVILSLKVRKLKQQLVVLSFSEKLINKLLVKKGLITSSEIDIITNEAIGDMPEDDGNKIIKCAKSLGVMIPKYMDEEELMKYVETQELKRGNAQISYTDRMIMDNPDF